MKNDKYANDNNDPWSSIGWQANLILNKLRIRAQLSDNSEQERDKVKGGQEKQDQPTDEQRQETERADLERRIRDMTRMERRLTRNRI